MSTEEKEKFAIIHFVVMAIGEFSRRYNLTMKEAGNYLARFKGIDFVLDHYGVEHQLSLADCVADMAAICRRNGGMVR